MSNLRRDAFRSCSLPIVVQVKYHKVMNDLYEQLTQLFKAPDDHGA